MLEALVSVAAYFFVNKQAGLAFGHLATSGDIYIKATTMTLGAIVFSQIANVINCRTEKVSVFKKGLFINPHIWTGILFEIILFIILTVTPGVQGIFNTGILGVSDWMMLCLIPIPLILIEEARKWLFRIKK